MKKEQLKEAILFFASKYKKKEIYEEVYKNGVPEIMRLLAYDMFLNAFNPYLSDDFTYKQYKIIYDYCKELEENGFFNFQR